jgi:hypothetical protein
MAKKSAKPAQALLAAAPQVVIDSIAGDTNDPATVNAPSPWSVIGHVVLNGATLTSLAYQIDEGALVTVPTANPFHFNLNENDLPDVGTTYVLSVYAWAREGTSKPVVGIGQKGVYRAS